MGESVQMVFFRFVAAVILVGLLAVVGVNIYNAGVSAGIASDVGNAIASGAPVPAGYYYGPYAGQPWHGVRVRRVPARAPVPVLLLRPAARHLRLGPMGRSPRW